MQIKVFHCLEMKHPLCDGVQRIRCYPFPTHTFHKRNLQHTVFLLPVDATDDFQLPRDKAFLQYGRVLLFFRIRIEVEEEISFLDCAFIKYFDIYKAPGEEHVLSMYGSCF